MLKRHKDYSFGEIALFSAIIALVSFTLWYAYNANSNANKIYDSISSAGAAKSSKVTVESDPSDVSIKSVNYCDSGKLKKLTPFSCSIPEGVSSITLIAPVTTTENGVKYNFNAWTGCSGMRTDKYTCKVALPAKYPAKATYTTGATSNSAAPPPSAAAGPQARCNGTLTNGGKTCRYVITYDQNRMPGRLSAVPIQTNPNKNIYDGLTITGECSADGACATYEPNPQQLTGPVTKDRIDLNISKPTTITIDVPMSRDTGSSGGYYLLSQFVYNKATYANGGGGTYFDSLTAEYTLQYRL